MRDAIRRGRDGALTEVRKPSDGLVSPGLLLEALQQRFGPEAIYTTDSGNGTFLAIEGLVVDEPQHLLAPVDYSCMGYSVPAAIGAKLARPDAPVIALAGDGAFLMTGLEMLTASSLGLPVMFMVLRDRELAQIAQFQSTAFGRKANSELPDYEFAAIARGVGVECLALGNDGEIGEVLESAAKILAKVRPVAVDVAIDYSRKTFFTRGVVKTNLLRLPWKDRLRFVGRAIARKVSANLGSE
jgi:acetolactate synthase-1/2/3 large subunit